MNVGLLSGEEDLSAENEGETGTQTEEESDFLVDDEPQTVLISEEDITKRSSNIKYFLNEDHSYTAAVYPNPVHYEEDGEWKEINLCDVYTSEWEKGRPFYYESCKKLV